MFAQKMKAICADLSVREIMVTGFLGSKRGTVSQSTLKLTLKP